MGISYGPTTPNGPEFVLRSSQAVIEAVPERPAPNVDHRRGPEVALAELLVAAPAHLDRAARGAGQPGRLDRDLATVLAAEPAAGVRHDHPHVRLGDAKRRGELAAHAEGHLRATPHGQPTRLPLRKRNPGLEGNVGDVRGGVRGAERDRRRRERPFEVADFVVERALPAQVLDRVRAQVLDEIGLGWLRRHVPGGLDRPQRTPALNGSAATTPTNGPSLDDRHARHRGGPRDVDRPERRADGRCSQHAPVEHPRPGQVRWVAAWAPVTMAGAVTRRAGCPTSRSAGPGVSAAPGEARSHPPHPAHQLPVGHRASGLRVPDGALGRDEVVGRDVPAEPRRGRPGGRALRQRPAEAARRFPASSGSRRCPCRTGTGPCRPSPAGPPGGQSEAPRRPAARARCGCPARHRPSR